MIPDGPAPMTRASMPTLALSLSRPWMAQEAGSMSVASSSEMLWILKTLRASLQGRGKRFVSYSTYLSDNVPATKVK